MIHGREASIGCVAMGDHAVEKLFVLAADAGWADADVVIAPVDLRSNVLPLELARQPRAESLYSKVRNALAQYPTAAVTRPPN